MWRHMLKERPHRDFCPWTFRAVYVEFTQWLSDVINTALRSDLLNSTNTARKVQEKKSPPE